MKNTVTTFTFLFFLAGCSISSQQSSTEPDATTAPAPKESSMTDITPPSEAAPTAFTHTVTQETEYYLSGPQQGRPSEGKLPAGTKVAAGADKMGQYIFVESESGIKAWIHESALKVID